MKAFSLVCIAFLSSLSAIPCKKYPEPLHPEDLFRKEACTLTPSTSFLWWAPCTGSLDYALLPKDSVSQSPTIGANGAYKRASFDWSPGLRIALSYFNAPRYWEITGQYTWLYASGAERLSPTGDPTKPVTGTFQTSLPTPLSSAATAISQNYSLGDLLIARVYLTDTNPHLRLKFFGGFTGGWLKQSWHTTYTNTQNGTATIDREWSYWGIGMRAGASFDWYWWRDLYLTGLSSVALTVGSYNNDALTTASVATTPFTHTSYDDTRLAPTAQFLAGPSYQKNFQSNRIECFVGYELTIWGNLHEVFRSDYSFGGTNYKQTSINNGLLGFQGVTARLSVDF
jgi:hypothetical protein